MRQRFKKNKPDKQTNNSTKIKNVKKSNKIKLKKQVNIYTCIYKIETRLKQKIYSKKKRY